MSRTRRFVNVPPGTVLTVTAIAQPPGSVQKVNTLAIDGVLQGPAAPVPSPLTVPCDQSDTVYAVKIQASWLAKGHLIVVPFVTFPDSDVVTREPIVLSGDAGAVDSCRINVSTS